MGRAVIGMPFATGALLAAVALGGCQAETPGTPAAPSASATVSGVSPRPSASSASPSTSASASIPAAAREKTEAGAQAFVRYFFDQVNVAWTEPRPGLIKSLSDPTCEFCAQVEATSRSLADHGHRYRQRAVTIKALAKRSGAPSDQYFFDVVLVQHAAEVVDRSGNVVRTDDEGEGASLVGAKWIGTGWTLLGVEVA